MGYACSRSDSHRNSVAGDCSCVSPNAQAELNRDAADAVDVAYVDLDGHFAHHDPAAAEWSSSYVGAQGLDLLQLTVEQ